MSRWRRVIVAWAWLSASVSGCGPMLGPEAMPEARVRGVVRVGPRPVGGGWVEFLPVENTVGRLASAKLASDGSFMAEHVPVGRVALRIVHPPFPLPCDRIFERVFLIRVEIPTGPAPPLAIDLQAESARHCPEGVARVRP